MYKVEILIDYTEENIINLLHTKERKIKSVKDSYIMNSFISQNDYKQMYKKLFNKKTNTPTNRNMETFNEAILFKFDIDMNKEGCKIIGKFCFAKYVKFFCLLYHIVCLFIFFESALNIDILFTVLIMIPMISTDFTLPRKLRAYRESVLCKMEEDLNQKDINIIFVKRYNFFNK